MRVPLSLCVALALTACDDDGGTALVGLDAGASRDDAGRTLDDAGRVLDDAGRVLDDAGRVLDDAGRVLDDAGRVLDDAGRVLDDAGQPLDDAGVPIEPDAAPPPCQPIEADGVLDFDLPRIRVRGAVTLNGAPIDAADLAGAVRFTHVRSGHAGVVAPDDDGYSITLAPGRYDVDYLPDALGCEPEEVPALPCTGGPLHDGLELAADGVLDLDLRAVTVRGAVTLDGAALPDEPLSLSFTAHTSAAVPVRDGAYAARLWPAEYALDLTRPPGACAELPCMSGRLLDGLRLENDGVLDVDVPRVEVRGAVRKDATPIGPAVANRGAVLFVRADGATAAVAASSDYRVVLLPGEYTLRWQPAAPCDPEADDALPCTDGPLRDGPMRDGLRLVDDGVLDVDVPVVVVRGTVTVDGAPREQPGALAFRAADGAGVVALVEADYRFPMLPATYDVAWVGAPERCADREAEVPCNEGLLRADLQLVQDGVLDFDVPSVRVRGALTHQGTPLDEPATLGFGDAAVPVVDGAYDVRLFPGTYDIDWLGAQPCGETLPCPSGPLRAGVRLQADGVLDFDVPSVRVRGSVTVLGAPLSEPRGALRFALRAGGVAAAALDPGYDQRLLPGCYTVDWTPGARPCEADLPCLDVRLTDPD